MPKPKKSKARASRSAKPFNKSGQFQSSALVPASAPVVPPWKLASEEITIIKNSIAKGASDTELAYCLKVAERYKLDPFKRQMWFVSRWDKNADNGRGGTGANVWTPQIGIDGLLFIANRDHRSDFGSVSLPEFGPMIEGHPEWAIIKVWKKGEPEPTVAQAWWDEYAPADLTKAPFWRKMPRRMLSKCATALALRQAYPDLGGMHIPEEMERMSDDVTPGGRQIVQPDHSYEEAKAAQKQIADSKIAEHEAKKASEGVPGAAWKQEEERKADTPPKANIPPKQAPIDVQPTHTVTSDLPDSESKGQIEVDWTADRNSPIVRGDIANVMPVMEKYCKMTWGADSWWHCAITDVETIRQMCEQFSYKFVQILPNDPEPEKRKRTSSAKKEPAENKPQSAGGASTAGGNPAAPKVAQEPTLVTGTIEQCTEKMTRGSPATEKSKGRPSSPYLSILVLTADRKKTFMSVFDHDMFKFIQPATGKNVLCQLFVKVSGDYCNVVGLKSIGSQQFEDGKVPVIQRSEQQAGGRTLFP